jgi:hypothetical protein
MENAKTNLFPLAVELAMTSEDAPLVVDERADGGSVSSAVFRFEPPKAVTSGFVIPETKEAEPLVPSKYKAPAPKFALYTSGDGLPVLEAVVAVPPVVVVWKSNAAIKAAFALAVSIIKLANGNNLFFMLI